MKRYPRHRGVRKLAVLSYDLDEMLSTKLRALLQREHGRDLLDLWGAWDASQATGADARVNPARVGEAFRFYMAQAGSIFDSTKVRSELERGMSSLKFLAMPTSKDACQVALPTPLGRPATCSSRCFCLT
ncbi:hypothetical protein CGK74_12015 [Thauera propionica]|uniref:Uncharacterized protein n=1 Tax=Thauera propionica TaxID=2019431 RepID=A0A235EZ16_9RHOO|nr:hypothetical protein CGK74_12015 [Thauera propionica]